VRPLCYLPGSEPISKPAVAGTSYSRQQPGKLVECQYPCSKLKLDQLFLEWLSRPESQQLVRHRCQRSATQATLPPLVASQVTSLIEDAKAGRPIRGPTPHGAHANHGTPTPLSPTTSHAMFAATVRSNRPIRRATPTGLTAVLCAAASALPAQAAVSALSDVSGPQGVHRKHSEAGTASLGPFTDRQQFTTNAHAGRYRCNQYRSSTSPPTTTCPKTCEPPASPR
jgi:hypothetical protein